MTPPVRPPTLPAITRWLWAAVFVLPGLTSPLQASAQPRESSALVLGDSTAPAPRAGATMAFDGQQQRLLMFGGSGNDLAIQLLDTWTWDGTRWQLLDGQGPANSGATMVYDDASGQVLLLTQQVDSPSDPRLGTWLWDGSTWQDLQPNTSPPAGFWSGAAYDPDAAAVIALTARASVSDPVEEMWAWDGSTWTRLHPTHMPPVSDGVALVYDSENHQLIREGTGGLSNAQGIAADTWAWGGTDWTQLKPAHHPAYLLGAAVAFDPSARRVVLVDGSDSSRTCGTSTDRWVWNGQDWQNMGPTPNVIGRTRAALAYDSATSQLVLFGGCHGSTASTPGGLLQDTNVLRVPGSNIVSPTAKVATILQGELGTTSDHHFVELLVMDSAHPNGDPSAGGTATVVFGGAALAEAPLQAGHATIAMPTGDPGLGTITVRYSGDATHCGNVVDVYSRQHPSGPATSAASPPC